MVLGAVGAPATPFLVAGAAIFGALWGTVWNLVGDLPGVVAPASGWRACWGASSSKGSAATRSNAPSSILHRRGFVPLVAVRFLPIPFPLVNAAAAVVGVRFPQVPRSPRRSASCRRSRSSPISPRLLDAATGDRGEVVRQLAIVSGATVFLVFLPVAICRRRRIWRCAGCAANAPPGALPRETRLAAERGLDVVHVEQEDALAGVLLGVELEVADDPAEDLLQRAGAEARLARGGARDGARRVGGDRELDAAALEVGAGLGEARSRGSRGRSSAARRSPRSSSSTTASKRERNCGLMP